LADCLALSAQIADENLKAIVACWDKLDDDMRVSLRLKAEALSASWRTSPNAE
jgi:hypothetical protein